MILFSFSCFQLFHRRQILIRGGKQDGIYLSLVIYSCYPVMDCLDELGLTRQPILETVLEVEYDVVFVCFHMLLRIMCSITLQRIHVNEMGM